MDAQNKEVDALVQKITGLHAAIAKLPSLSPSPDVDALFTDLVTACVPPSPVDVTKLGPEAQEMREGLIRLCSEAEGKLEAHYSDMLAAFDNPLDHLGIFPYYSNYINISKLDALRARRHRPGPRRVHRLRPAAVQLLRPRRPPPARHHVRQLRPVRRGQRPRDQAVPRGQGRGRPHVVPHHRRRGPHRRARCVRRRLPGRARGHGCRGQGQGDRAPRRAHGGRGGPRRAQRARGAWVPVPDRRSSGHRSRRVRGAGRVSPRRRRGELRHHRTKVQGHACQ
ncbi:hypothetical protein ACQJBY_032950 [Aegilops geniculata]